MGSLFSEWTDWIHFAVGALSSISSLGLAGDELKPTDL